MLKDLVKSLKPSSTLAINETSRKLEEQGKKIFKFGYFDKEYGVLHPKVRVTYLRSYYKVSNVRVTIDKEITYIKLNNQNKEINKSDHKKIVDSYREEEKKIEELR